MPNNSTNSSTLDHALPFRSKTFVITLSFFMALIIILSVSGNILMISAIMRSHRLRSAFANKLITSLALSDFLTAAIPLTYQLVTVLDISLISNGGLLCTIGGLSAYAFFYVSLMTMVMLSVDRFVALGFPLQHSLRMTFKVRTVMLSFPWVHTTLFCIFALIYTDIEFDWESMSCGFSWDKVPMGFTLYLLLVHVSIPFVVLFVLCSWTVRLVRLQNKEILRLQARVSPIEGDRTNSQKSLRASRRGKQTLFFLF